MVVNPNPQPVGFAAWESPSLIVTMTTNGSISGQTFQLNIRDESGNVLLTLNSADNPTQFAVVDAGSVSTPGIFSFTLTSAQAGALQSSSPNTVPADYAYDIWRVDSGSEKELTWGTMNVRSQQWKP